jgi:hypothetical protein
VGGQQLRTPNWIKKLGGHAGELYVCAELSKRGVPNALLPENFTDDDILVGNKAATHTAFIQVKSCHPDRSTTFILRETDEKWISAKDNEYCAFVWLGKPATFEPPRYWLAKKREVGKLCVKHLAHATSNWERRFGIDKPDGLPREWENRWSLFDAFRPAD